ncbi:MAG: hypothetical protein K0R66_1553 [Gammaproteobacteria bacterium]|nr:hypothetical protein [Gammaproteobacteria bacterium]
MTRAIHALALRVALKRAQKLLLHFCRTHDSFGIRVQIRFLLLIEIKMGLLAPFSFLYGGEGGIRTLDTAFDRILP